ncbi:hypothetical protein [uncultured Algibacter sp.]|uniref:hypothetical protein n=1 Tax=uncultured Algibacter sp. TaxID=298659 RepID=UPI00261C1CB7|nr:hypothetical protein [uncultured Algibacter sp.]
MTKQVISISLSALFMLFVIAPTVIMIIDDSVDVSMFYSSTEEEEKSHEKNKDKELLLFDFSKALSDLDLNETENNLVYFFKKYPKPHLNLISPPPELFIV